MKAYKITGTLRPMYNPLVPYYSHDLSTMPKGKPYPNGEERNISVTTINKEVAETMKTIFEKVYQDVTLEVVKT